MRSVAEESAAWAQWAETSNVGDLAMEQVMADIQAVARDYLTDDPVTVFKATRRHRDRVFALLEGHQHPRQASDLYAAAGYLCTLLAWMSSDLGKLNDADTQGRTAWLCAELAGHDDLRAWVLSTRSKVAMWDGRMRDAITHAQHGAAVGGSGTVGVLLACQEADAWSQLGASAQAGAALGRALEARDAMTAPDEIAGLLSCPEIRRINYSSSVHLRGGDASTALRELDAALAGPSHSYGTTAQMQIARASAHVALGALDGATAALEPVFMLPSDQRLAPVTGRLREVARAVARCPAAGSRAAAGLQGAIEEWCLDSVPRHFTLSPSTGTR
ncbi:XRE family transcriptional regulator [Streptomyces sp. ISL-44]|nr:XRE family transcriptional regulator [Streptomyces sp. ISL-44]